jgi:hypothetical protein
MKDEINLCPNCKVKIELIYKLYRDIDDLRTGNIYYCNLCKKKYERILGKGACFPWFKQTRKK